MKTWIILFSILITNIAISQSIGPTIFESVIGALAGTSLGNGSNNVFLGMGSGSNNYNGDNNIFIGAGAGYWENGSNKLYIDNSSSNTPLIYGEFDNNLVKVNGTLHITETAKLIPLGTAPTCTSAEEGCY